MKTRKLPQTILSRSSMRMSVSPRSRMPRRGCSTNVQKHRERPDPEAVAVELFWWDYLHYIPHEEEVARCLDNEFVAGEEDAM
jgi:hypothetical protein